MTYLSVDSQCMESRGDSGAYASNLQKYTTSLASTATDYKFVHGRRYHSYEEGRYVFPNDEAESDRLDLMHTVFKLALRGSAFSAPVAAPARVLDIGTGTGIWAVEAGDIFPDADILGNDLSPIQPRWVPPNVRFEVDDVEKPWTFDRPFDFVHCRGMYGSIRDWPQLVRNVFDNTAPGAYAEFTDLDAVLDSPDGSIDGTNFKMANTYLCENLDRAGTTPRPGPFLVAWMQEAGFEIVHARAVPLPFGVWAKDKDMKQLGAYNYMQFIEGLEGFLIYTMHVKEGWAKPEVDVLCAKVRAELKDKSIHSMLTLYNVVGRRPG